MSEPQGREPMHQRQAGAGACEQDVAADDDPSYPVPLFGSRACAQNGAGRQAQEEAGRYGHAERVTKMGAVQPHRTEDDRADRNMQAVGTRRVRAASERAHIARAATAAT